MSRWLGLRLLLLCAIFGNAQPRPEASSVQVLQQIQARDFQRASATLKLLLRASPANAEYWNLLGICESELDDNSGARSAFESGLRLAPDSISLNENLGYLFYKTGDYSSAKKYLSRAVALGSPQAGVAFSLAACQIRTGERERGLTTLRELESRLAGVADYWTERGWVELRNNPSDASGSFDKALAIEPQNIRALNGAASSAELGHQDERALSFLMRAKRERPDDIQILLHFGSLCLRAKLPVDALAALERAHELAPQNNLALFLLARAHICFERWELAHQLFTDYDKRVPGYEPTQYALGWLDIKLNRTGEARTHLLRAIALAPADYEAQFELGHLELDAGNLASAEANLKAVVSAIPTHARALTAYGDLMMKRGNLRQAKAQYEAAIAADKSFGPAHYKLSTVWIRMNEMERAAAERQLGVDLNAAMMKAGKTVLVLAEPDGTLVSDLSSETGH
jgi:tetratricopeptide (TPR) repeat protein